MAVNHLGLSQDEGLKHSLFEETQAIQKEAKKNGMTAGQILEIAGDISKPETSTELVKAAVAEWGKLDLFVSNAAVFKPAEFLK